MSPTSPTWAVSGRAQRSSVCPHLPACSCPQAGGWPGEAAAWKNASVRQQKEELNAEPQLWLSGSVQPQITLESHQRSGVRLPGPQKRRRKDYLVPRGKQAIVLVISFGYFIVFFMSQAGLQCVCKRKFCSVAERQLLCHGATNSLLFPELLFLFANARGLKDTARWQESLPPAKVIRKRSCSRCHRAQGARPARPTSFATSQQNPRSVHLPRGGAALTTGLRTGDIFKDCHLLLSFL